MSKVTVIPGVSKLQCEKCGARARVEEVVNGKCWKCKSDVSTPN